MRRRRWKRWDLKENRSLSYNLKYEARLDVCVGKRKVKKSQPDVAFSLTPFTAAASSLATEPRPLRGQVLGPASLMSATC